jgi:hypothetical protein
MFPEANLYTLARPGLALGLGAAVKGLKSFVREYVWRLSVVYN